MQNPLATTQSIWIKCLKCSPTCAWSPMRGATFGKCGAGSFFQANIALSHWRDGGSLRRPLIHRGRSSGNLYFYISLMRMNLLKLPYGGSNIAARATEELGRSCGDCFGIITGRGIVLYL